MSLLYTAPNPYQHFIRPCSQAKYHPTALAYPVSSSTSDGAICSSVAPTIQTTHGILVTPCSNHYIADEAGGDSGAAERAQSEECRQNESRENMENMDDGDGDAMECDPFDSDSDSDSDDDDDADAGWSAEDDDNDEDEEDIEHNTNTNTGLAVPGYTKAIKPRSSSSPSLSTTQPKPQPKRFRRELLSGPVQHLRMKWKKAVVNRSLQKSAAAAAASAAQAEPRRPFINDGFLS